MYEGPASENATTGGISRSKPLANVIAFRLESNVLYVNAESVLETVLERIEMAKPADLRLVVCDLSASPFLDLAGTEMLQKLHAKLAERKIPLCIVGAHGRVRELLRNVNFTEKVGGIERGSTLNEVLNIKRISRCV